MLVAILLAALVGCAAPLGGLNQSTMTIEQAQVRVRFPIRVPRCLPSSVAPTPARIAVVNNADNGYQSINIDYAYRVRPTRVPGNLQFAIAIIEQQNVGGENALVMVGQHKVLDGLPVVMTKPPLTPGMEWIEDTVRFELSTTLTWTDTLGIYHSMVTGTDDCTLPPGWQ